MVDKDNNGNDRTDSTGASKIRNNVLQNMGSYFDKSSIEEVEGEIWIDPWMLTVVLTVNVPDFLIEGKEDVMDIED